MQRAGKAGHWGLLIGALGVLMGACAPPPDLHEIPGQVAFMADAWSYFYQRTDAPPQVEWMTGDRLDCDNGTGFTSRDGTLCLGGSHTNEDGYIRLALIGPHPDWLSLCHELAHVIHQRDGHEDIGEDHSDPDFAPGGRVEKCAEAVWNLEQRS